ncbi:PLC-like phosphodiesterase [Nadsonia fulvescens var. elongata DSM 6958]|uniref:PLC-like phosphodiesterase n=1 Tax=Nadsonia fulvescens var. elongata DSM 6958 TaxID=857566 RepID=A0A1E3PDZ8_9ASCO|nr:PLC-like phosphodiesterase [Nadsonia fulvescens var. elongata DSM 6958]
MLSTASSIASSMVSSVVSNSFLHAPKRYAPICSGHRGYRGKFPENSMLSFHEGVDAGVKIIETDLQVSSDGVVVISHDYNTQRCFGVDYLVPETPYYGVLDQLVTPDDFKQKMPTLKDLAQLYLTPQYASTALMLDIKPENQVNVIDKIIAALLEVKPDLAFWALRTTLGIWTPEFLDRCQHKASEFRITHIGASHYHARQFLAHPQVACISLNINLLTSAVGKSLIKQARKLNKAVYSWTVNDEKWMKWCIESNIDGVITDFPDRYMEILNKDYSDPNPAITPEPTSLPLLHFNPDQYIGWYHWLASPYTVMKLEWHVYNKFNAERQRRAKNAARLAVVEVKAS